MAHSRPLAIDMFCGLSGWGHGLSAAGYHVIGFDIENMFAALGEPEPEHFALVLQDARTLHGSQFKGAALIVASPPCQFFSYVSMPWTRAKERAARTRADPALLAKELELFNACFRIQREACEAAGRHIPMVVENVRGAIPWVGRSRWNFGSYHLWGDVPALMPMTKTRFHKISSPHLHLGDPRSQPGSAARMRYEERKLPGFRFDGSGRSFQTASVEAHVQEGRKGAGAGAAWWRNPNNPSMLPSASPRRKAASARIAKIPRALSEWIGRAWFPPQSETA